MRMSTKAWLGIGVAVITWDAFCPEGEMLSHGYDNFLARHPYITWVFTMLTAAHLLNVAPKVIDPWHLIARVCRAG